MKITIKGIMGAKSITLAQLARDLSIDKGQLSRQINNDDMRESMLREIADGLGCELDIRFIDRDTGFVYNFPEPTPARKKRSSLAGRQRDVNGNWLD